MARREAMPVPDEEREVSRSWALGRLSHALGSVSWTEREGNQVTVLRAGT